MRGVFVTARPAFLLCAQGKYDDFHVEWYGSVGAMLVLAMVANIFGALLWAPSVRWLAVCAGWVCSLRWFGAVEPDSHACPTAPDSTCSAAHRTPVWLVPPVHPPTPRAEARHFPHPECATVQLLCDVAV